VEKDTRNGLILFLSAILLFGAVIGMVAYYIGRTHSGTDERIRQELAEARRVNIELKREQQRDLEFIARIRTVTEETTGIIGEFGELNRGLSGISKAIAEEADLLANYHRSVSGIVDDYDNNSGGE